MAQIRRGRAFWETTINEYKGSGMRQQAFVESRGLKLSTFQRWLHPSTRRGRTLQLRAYLRWLHEQGVLVQHPEDLIRRSDLPRLPSYLPRPLPPQADQQLQVRLGWSNSPYRMGLLLMRKTGIRVGELRSLPFDCLRIDEKKNKFLKVPLGKLNTERLVPLDKETVRLVRRIKRTGKRKRRWLLENPPGKKTQNVQYNRILRQACEGLDIPDLINTHRLRHTYASSMLNAGMSLVGVMKLLGHHDYRMTLRYAAITQETVLKEYNEALVELQAKYKLSVVPKSSTAAPDPGKMLSDVIRWLKKAYANDASRERESRLLVRRLTRVRRDLRSLMRRRR